MSYDLYLFPRADGTLNAQAFAKFFQGRRNYKVEGAQVVYMNDATGVYFVFEFIPASNDEILDQQLESEADATPERRQPHILFNLNYYRPHTFGLEAAPELECCVRHFDMFVDDPQLDGMGRGAYSNEGFLRGWNKGNSFAIQTIQKTPEYKARPITTIPVAELENNWRWSYKREELLAELKNDIFIPRIFYFLIEGQLRTAIVWGDGIPIAIPRTEVVILFREQLQKRILGFGKANSMACVKFGQLEPFLRPYSQKKSVLEYFLLDYQSPPKDLVKFIQDQPEVSKEFLKPLQLDEVFGRELVAQVLT